MLRTKFFGSFFGFRGDLSLLLIGNPYPPAPRSIGITGLGEIRPQYLAAQSVTGKILKTRNLASRRCPNAERYRELMICLLAGCAQGRMSQGAVDFKGKFPELQDELFFRPFRDCSFPALGPTPNGAGCILSPFRGWR
jgi:hypothetical protein